MVSRLLKQEAKGLRKKLQEAEKHIRNVLRAQYKKRGHIYFPEGENGVMKCTTQKQRTQFNAQTSTQMENGKKTPTTP